MREITQICIGISVGDPNGIGVEIILKAFRDKRLFSFFTPVVFAHFETLKAEAKKMDISTELLEIKKIQGAKSGKLNIMNSWQAPFNINYGKEEAAAGQAAFTSLEAATQALKQDQIDALVTAPIHKKSIQSEQFNFPGHTDYLSQELGGTPLMFMIAEGLRVALVTDHTPLSSVVEQLTASRISAKIDLLTTSLIKDFGLQRPKIAVLGINPHAGDQGVIGKEDDTILRPLIKKYQEKGALVFGPFPADGFFGSQSYQNYDAVLAMYHDQGLIPFKALSFGKGVNFTAGLKKVRTSPDHGTAFAIAGQGKATTSSFIEALFTARSIYLQRQTAGEEG